MLNHDINPETERQKRAYGSDHLIRPRINMLLAEALKKRLVVVSAGAGYGKTRAVSDFVHESEIPTIWIQLSEHDNSSSRFWEIYTKAIGQIDESLVEEFRELGFPKTEDKLNKYLNIQNKGLANRKYRLILDDVHLINDISVLLFLERIIHDIQVNFSIILICRELPQIYMEDLRNENLVFDINEDELNFTQNELAEYIRDQSLSVESQTLYEIFLDTKGWAFSINLVARSLRKSPGYSGYVRNAMKQNVLKIMDNEIWRTASEQFKCFLVKLSLIDHLSADLITVLIGEDNNLLTELRQVNAYIRFDNYMGAYLIHHLFLDFLHTKQDILTDEEKRETYEIAADWCIQNNFRFDALKYYEKAEDYDSIVSVVSRFFAQVYHGVTLCSADIFERAPAEQFDQVEFLAVMHLYTLYCLGPAEKFLELAAYYEQKFLAMPDDNVFRNHTLGGIYYLLGIVGTEVNAAADIYNIEDYFAKMDRCFTKSPLDKQFQYPVGGHWANPASASSQGAPARYIKVMTRAAKYLSHCLKGTMMGLVELLNGELLFYQGEIKAAKVLIMQALDCAQEHKQFEVIHKALFYILRIAVWQGDHTKAEQALKDIEAQLSEKDYAYRFFNYDIAASWYYYMLRQPKKVLAWLKDGFIDSGHAYSIHNSENQVRARYHYLQKNYSPLLTYIEEMKQQVSVLYGRIEMLAIEACVRYQMKDKPAAFKVLREAYETALPNDVLMPFIELGKDMLTLTSAALREPDCSIPKTWLETVHLKSVSYAKYQSKFILDYKKAKGDNNLIALTFPEIEVLRDLYHGLSRSEIAANRNLPINRIKVLVNNIYEKLGACNIVDVIRIAVERKLI